MKCKICFGKSVPFSVAQILKKFNVQYFTCERCGFIQTEDPYWLEEAYGKAIARSDIGLINRNIMFSALCASFIPFNVTKGKFLDYGGGNGMFVRMMRDRGFDFYWFDKYAENQFAEGFELINGIEFSLLTALEVFEHLPNPLEEIEHMFSYSKNILFSTRLIPRWRIEPMRWWYYALDTGQHISFYSKKSLEVVADKFNVKLSSNGVSFHIFSEKKYPGLFLKALSYYPFSSFLASVLGVRRESLLPVDYFHLTGNHLR